MSDLAMLDDYAELTEPTTLTIRRLLPGPIERVWAYLTESELRRKWLAAGEMELKEGASFTFIWRNDALSRSADQRPAGFAEEQRMESRITAIDPPNMLAVSWDGTGGVLFTLKALGEETLLTVTHRRIESPDALRSTIAGWHAHLDILRATMGGATPPAFWPHWLALRETYAARLPK